MRTSSKCEALPTSRRSDFALLRMYATEAAARLGRIRSLLRLGERADVRAARRGVLAADRAARAPRPALELGCGTGAAAACRSLAPATDRHRHRPVRADARASRARARRAAAAASSGRGVVRGDIRALPFRRRIVRPGDRAVRHAAVADLATSTSSATLAEAARVLRPGGLLGVDLVPDLPRWPAVSQARSACAAGAAPATTVTLVESVRQDRRRGLTIFDEEFVERRRGRVRRHQFSLTFRTLPMKATLARLERAGFASRPCSATTTAAPGTSARTSGSYWRGDVEAATGTSHGRRRATLESSGRDLEYRCPPDVPGTSAC